MSALCSAFSRLQLGSHLAMRATPLVSREAVVPPVRRASVLVEALGNKDSVKRREAQNKKNMLYNRRYKDEIKYYSKKALKGMNLMMKEPDQVQSETDLAEIQGWINSAFSIIDKAVLKGVLHKNTGARRKARLSANRRRLLIAAGLYTPA